MSELETHISEVTVYPDRARITRQGSASVEKGIQRLGFVNLPLALDPDSARALARGVARATLLGLEVERTYTTEAPAEHVHELEQQIEALQDQRTGLDAEFDLATQSRSNLAAVAAKTDTFALALASGRQALEDQLAIFENLNQRMASLNQQILDLQVRKRGLERNLQKLQQELQRWQGSPRREAYTAWVELEVSSPGELTVELTYVVDSAGWQPLYDFRLADEPEGQPVLEVAYLSQVTQQSGESWEDVSLTLSTARPALASRLPELHPWYVQPIRPPVPMPAPRVAEAAPQMVKRSMPVQAAPALAMEEAFAEEQQAEVETAGASVSYRVPASVSIPADGSPHKVMVTRFRLEPKLDYVTAPRLVEAVYRRAKIVNESPYTLLPGPANLFAAQEFIGITRLELIAPQAEFELYLGVDDRLKVKRELKRREVDKKLIGGWRRVAYAFEISLQNFLPIQAQLALHDQFPVSQHEEIKVRLESASPQPAEHTELNLLQWNLSLAPQEKRTVRFDFSVESSPGLQLIGLP